jgi:hypothetical protein
MLPRVSITSLCAVKIAVLPRNNAWKVETLVVELEAEEVATGHATTVEDRVTWAETALNPGKKVLVPVATGHATTVEDLVTWAETVLKPRSKVLVLLAEVATGHATTVEVQATWVETARNPDREGVVAAVVAVEAAAVVAAVVAVVAVADVDAATKWLTLVANK